MYLCKDRVFQSDEQRLTFIYIIIATPRQKKPDFINSHSMWRKVAQKIPWAWAACWWFWVVWEHARFVATSPYSNHCRPTCRLWTNHFLSNISSEKLQTLSFYHLTYVIMLTLSQHDRTRGHTLKLSKHCTRRDVRLYFFSERVISNWNNVDQSVIEAGCVNTFKRHLHDHGNDKMDLFMD